jgi:hypothetical protein
MTPRSWEFRNHGGDDAPDCDRGLSKSGNASARMCAGRNCFSTSPSTSTRSACAMFICAALSAAGSAIAAVTVRGSEPVGG